jgi:hypothetical protein
MVLPVDAPRGVRLLVAAAAGQLRVLFGAADDEQQRQVDAPSRAHRAPPPAPPPDGRTVRPAGSWCAEAARSEERAGGGPVDSRFRSGRRPEGGRGRHPAAEAGTEPSPQKIDDKS